MYLIFSINLKQSSTKPRFDADVVVVVVDVVVVVGVVVVVDDDVVWSRRNV